MTNKPIPRPREAALTCPQCSAQLDAHLGISSNTTSSGALKHTVVVLCAFCTEPAIYEVVALTGTGYLRSPTPAELSEIYSSIPRLKDVRRKLRNCLPPPEEGAVTEYFGARWDSGRIDNAGGRGRRNGIW